MNIWKPVLPDSAVAGAGGFETRPYTFVVPRRRGLGVYRPNAWRAR